MPMDICSIDPILKLILVHLVMLNDSPSLSPVLIAQVSSLVLNTNM
jgi:hypothetical protein